MNMPESNHIPADLGIPHMDTKLKAYEPNPREGLVVQLSASENFGLTLAGNRRARRALVEAAWTYRYPARVSETLRARLEGLPKAVRDIAWKAQIRLCARYRRLRATGKKLPVVVAAIAREMAAFLWAIGREVAPG